jgi:hypothetical protein
VADRSWRELIGALLGVSAYTPARGYGPDLDDPAVERIRENMGGNLALQPTTFLRWYLADLESAQYQADAGNLMPAAQLCRAMRRDGVIAGLMGTLTSGLVRLPKKFYGSPESVERLKSRNGTRSVFDDMFPPSELALFAGDGYELGVAVGELVPVPGRDFPLFIRLEPEFLRYRWTENRWYYTSIAGMLPITPGDGRWILHTPGGRIAPWLSGRWPSLGRSYINKEHALLHRSNYGAKMANPARVAYAAAGSTEKEREGFLKKLMAWGTNTVFALPPGWRAELLESGGEGYKVFQEEIDTCDREFAVSIAGQVVTVDGGAGFSNSDIHRAIRADIIKDVAEQLAYTINTQGIPPWVGKTWGPAAIATGAIMEWDISRPKDLASEATSLNTAAGAIKALGEVLAAYGLELDIAEITTRYGIPIKGDTLGNGAPNAKPYSPPAEEEGAANDDAPEASAAAARWYDRPQTTKVARGYNRTAKRQRVEAVYREEDHPRDETGRFSNHGSAGAADASKAAHAEKSPAAHKAAADAHKAAAEKHRAEVARRQGLAGKPGASKADVKRHGAAALRHQKAAAEHDKLASYHAEQAGGRKKKKPTPTPTPAASKSEEKALSASKLADEAEKSGGHKAAAVAHWAAADAWSEHARKLSPEILRSSGKERKRLAAQQDAAIARVNFHRGESFRHEAAPAGKEEYAAAIAVARQRDADSAKVVGKAKTAAELGIHVEGPPQMLAAYDSAIQHGRFDKLIANKAVAFAHTETRDTRIDNKGSCYVFWGPLVGQGSATVVSHGGESYTKGVGPRSPEPLGPDLYGTTAMARDDQEARTIVMTHELSHHLHFSLDSGANKLVGGEGADREIKKAFHVRVDPAPWGSESYGKLRPGKWVASSYAAKNHLEWFAETHTAFVHAPEVLQAKDPEAYAQMVGWRKQAGMG